jgi:23S rRNA (cytosine1962-C5)-methyltransferase
MKAIYLKAGREKSVLQQHPWIFSGAIERVEDTPGAGETVEVFSARKEWLCRAAYSPESNIRARVWTWDENEAVDGAFFQRRFEKAIGLRKALIPPEETNALRWVHAESDGLPGVIADRYDDILVLQLLTAGADAWRDVICQSLVDLTGIKTVVERSDVDVRHLEGLKDMVQVLYGPQPPEPSPVVENGLTFGVDVLHGQKTGFYLDQRRNRKRVGELVRGRSLLNCFCYTGAFSVYALAGGAASVLSMDSSAESLQRARENLERNGYAADQSEWMEADVFYALRGLRDRGRKFDAIILDPPKFAATAAQAERAARGYKDINLLAFKMLNPGGLLFTFSCSGGVSAELFQKIVAGAALDAKVDARIVERFTQGPDHPIALNFPEGAYLKGLVCQVG